jgi:F-type H+-transporting ATPase subunit b
MALLEALGFNLGTFLSQLINFAILYFILKKFALDKIFSAMEKRRVAIDAGLKDAQIAKLALDQARAQQEEIVNESYKEAKNILANARAQGKQQRDRIVAKAKEQAKQIVDIGRRQNQVDREKMLLEVKEELVDIIAVGIKQVAGRKISSREISTSYLTSLKA